MTNLERLESSSAFQFLDQVTAELRSGGRFERNFYSEDMLNLIQSTLNQIFKLHSLFVRVG